MRTETIRLVLRRLRVFLKHPSLTVEFPFVHRQLPHGSRISLRNNFLECIGCHKCEQACPVKCIQIQSQDFGSKEKVPKTSKGVAFEKKVLSFKIDYNQCVSCGLCADVCPTQSLTPDKALVASRQESRHLVIDLVHKPRSLRRDEGYED